MKEEVEAYCSLCKSPIPNRVIVYRHMVCYDCRRERARIASLAYANKVRKKKKSNAQD